MAYAGYLMKIGTFEFPNNLIALESYSAKENTLYADSYTDANGVTHAEPLAHKIDKVTFKTIMMDSDTFDSLMTSISTEYTEALSRTANCKYFVPEKGIYREESMHITDLQIDIDHVDDVNNKAWYKPITFTFTVW